MLFSYWLHCFLAGCTVCEHILLFLAGAVQVGKLERRLEAALADKEAAEQVQ